MKKKALILLAVSYILITACSNKSDFSSVDNNSSDSSSEERESSSSQTPTIRPSIPENYQSTTPTGGDIEEKYLKNGDFAVESCTFSASSPMKKFTYYYPEEIKTTNKKYPVILYSTGTGVKGSTCYPLFKHWASYGFVVGANEDKNTWAGTSSDATLSYLMELNNNEESIFYQKIDLDNIGVTGHSQGGTSVFNVLTNVSHSNMIKTGVALSPAHEELCERLHWPYDLTKITQPILMMAGTKGSFEIETVSPIDALNRMFDKITSPKCLARKTGYEHGHTSYIADGYVTAWFMWQLQGDEEAAQAFIGEQPEIINNELYQDQRIAI